MRFSLFVGLVFFSSLLRLSLQFFFLHWLFPALIHAMTYNMLVIFFRFRSRVFPVCVFFSCFTLRTVYSFGKRAPTHQHTKLLNVTQFGLIMCQVACSFKEQKKKRCCLCVQNGKCVYGPFEGISLI